MKPERFDFPDHTKGTTFDFDGPITYKYRNDTPIDLTGSRIDLWFRKKDAEGFPVLKWSTSDNTLTFIDTPNGIFDIPKSKVSIPAGIYYYDILLTLPSGEPYVFVYGYLKVISKSSQA